MKRLLAAAALLVLLIVVMRRTRTAAAPPPPPAPPAAWALEAGAPRLRFGVRRRHGRRRHGRRRADGESASSAQQTVGDASPPTPSSQQQQPQQRSDRRAVDRPLQSTTGGAGGCGLDGTQRGSGCHGHTCFLGACFCGGGSGGEWCERKGGAPRDCEAEAATAYSLRASGLLRFARHDACAFYEPAYGIVRVHERRWQAAQQWEAALWSNAPASQTSDRNAHHAANFGGYAALPNELGHVVELGCGPFTQLQSVLRASSKALSITLVDPLAGHYIEHTRGCAYRERRLLGRPVRVLSRPAEQLAQLRGAADTLVMVSVLQVRWHERACDGMRWHEMACACIRWHEMASAAHARTRSRAHAHAHAHVHARTRKRDRHSRSRDGPRFRQSVRDVPVALQAASNALRPGGWLVFADRVFDARWDAYRAAGEGARPFWDVGHPCAVKQTVLDHFLAGFEEVHLRRYTKEAPAGRPQPPPAERDEQLYFIGRKLG